MSWSVGSRGCTPLVDSHSPPILLLLRESDASYPKPLKPGSASIRLAALRLKSWRPAPRATARGRSSVPTVAPARLRPGPHIRGSWTISTVRAASPSLAAPDSDGWTRPFPSNPSPCGGHGQKKRFCQSSPPRVARCPRHQMVTPLGAQSEHSAPARSQVRFSAAPGQPQPLPSHRPQGGTAPIHQLPTETTRRADPPPDS